MKTQICSFGLMAMVWLSTPHSTWGQNPVITTFSHNGVLVCSNLNPGSVATVEWASSVTGPWQSDWSPLSAVPVTSSRTIQVSAPRFYRVRGASGTNSAPGGMVYIPAGPFTIGDTIDGNIAQDDGAPKTLTVSAFFMDTNLVSYSQWLAVFAYATNRGYRFSGLARGKETNHPVHAVNWYDCVKWSNARSVQAGLTPVYYTDEALTQVYTNGETDAVYGNWTAKGYRLPTEAEWEKAARGGVSGQRYPWGAFITWKEANYFSTTNVFNGYTFPSYVAYNLQPVVGLNPAYNSGVFPFTAPVGSFAPNGYGLFDMAGNLGQRCWDWYARPPYPVGSPYLGGTDPRGPAAGTYRVTRGGSWNHYASQVRCAFRSYYYNPGYSDSTIGFRCVRGL